MDNQPLKKSNSKLDFIIVGQGIAGSVLAIQLLQAGFKVRVINKPQLSTCSKAAAGIWNPVVFKRLTKSWLADDLVPELISFYEICETLFKNKLIYNRNIIKPFSEDLEKALWVKKAENENCFLDKNTYTDLKISKQFTVNDYSKVLHAGNIDVITFLQSTKNYLQSLNSYTEDVFDYAKLTHTDEQVIYNDINANNIVFCDGHLISNNPFFNWIPMKPAKGEILTIHCPELLLENDIFNKGFFVLPIGNHLYKIGATYEWQILNDYPTEIAKEELIKKINTVITIPYKIILHEAGIRPSVADRRPVIGPHPNFKNMFIFNGFGTKSIMLGPYFAKQFVNFIKINGNIIEDVNAKRFFKTVIS